MVQEYGEIYMITHPEIMESGNDSNQQVVFAEILDAYLHLLSMDYQLVSMARHRGGGGKYTQEYSPG